LEVGTKFVLPTSANVREFPTLISRIVHNFYKNDIVHVTGNTQSYYDALAGTIEFLEVEYRRNKLGWVYSGLLADYVEESDYQVYIPEEVKTKEFDAEQYIMWDGTKKTNLCGAYCAAYLAGEGIDSFLTKLKVYSPSSYTTNVTNNTPVGLSVIRTMVRMCELEFLELKRFFDDRLVGEFYSIAGFQRGLMAGWKAVLGVKIGYDGKLNGVIGHWVVLNEATPHRNGDGFVTIYNPFSNRLQKYSYNELIKSMSSFGGYTGLWVSPKH
jgi:hypothetical protein